MYLNSIFADRQVGSIASLGGDKIWL